MRQQSQLRKDEIINPLSADFQLRYEPNFAVANAVSTILALPGLRGFWPMSVVSSTPTAIDVSGLGKALAYNGNPTFGYSGLAPCAIYDGVGDFFTRADEADMDILGTEAYISSKGLTVGGWFNLSSLPGTLGLMGKYQSVGNQVSYLLRVQGGTNFPGLLVSATGVAGAAVAVNSTVVMTTGAWYFIVGRFIPSTELKIWVNGTPTSLLAGIPAAIFNSTASFEISGLNAGASNLITGLSSYHFLCASAVPDVQISNVYQQTKALYGV